ncbi:flagellar motor switch protein FliN [Enterobacterales bacterium CwR94]|nr:flagellar motor switch protein FliN [Enterobacterales bacterium CwR94]
MNDMTDNFDNEMDFDFSFDEPLTEVAEPEAPVAPVVETPAQRVVRNKKRHLSLFSRIPVTLTLEVASVEVSLAELINVDNDSIIELDKLAGEPLDVKVNGILFGKAEVVVLNDKYGLRIIEFNNKELAELTR